MARPRLIAILALAAAAIAVGAYSVSLARTSEQPSSGPRLSNDSEQCASCHSLSKDLAIKLSSGETLTLYVDSQVMAKSVHGGRLQCADCHRDISSYPHPSRQFENLRQYTIDQYETCKRFHFANYTKTLDSAHYARFSQGDANAPVCTDCHGAHDVSRPDQPRSLISHTCAQCHAQVNKSYEQSVHGKALTEGNADVPVCTDCHRVHNIQDPLTAEFRARSVQLCAKCHGDEQLMKKYGISTDVLETYLQSFHGMSVSLSGEAGEKRNIAEPVCTDCHGVHDIQQASAPTSPVMKENLTKTCEKCHAEATPNFPASWIGHYQPSLDKAPAVFLIRWFYRLLVPFIIGGLAVHILLDLWRVIINR